MGNNESVTYATRTCSAGIEAGVLELIVQGHHRGLWEIEEDNENE